MEKKYNIAILGAGVMGEAIVDGLLRNHLATAVQITVSDPLAERCEELKQKYGVQTSTENTPGLKDASVVILSVKPQHLPKLARSIKGLIPAEALVLSIVAGATLQRISESLGHPHIVRVMPNTPSRIGEGIAVWTNSPSVNPDQMEITREILSALGDEIYVDDESYLDMATALSGTGPAYVFLFMEAMVDAGVHLGFQRRIAEKLVMQTVKGSVDFYASRKTHLAALRNEVTSPAGTTAAALYYLEKAGFRNAISRAIWAAYERSQELGKGRDSQSPE